MQIFLLTYHKANWGEISQQVVIAPEEGTARELAYQAAIDHYHGGDTVQDDNEKRRVKKIMGYWLDAIQTTCELQSLDSARTLLYSGDDL